MDKLKVGDKVRVKHYDIRPYGWNDEGLMDEYMGKVVTVAKILTTEDIEIKEDGQRYIWGSEDFEKVEENMTKSDLKTGMIVTTRNGIEYAVLLNICFDAERNVLCNGNHTNWTSLDNYNENLTHYSSEKLDIVKIEKPYHPYSIQNLDYDKDKRILLWERKDPKKMTVAEIEQELGYQIEIVK